MTSVAGSAMVGAVVAQVALASVKRDVGCQLLQAIRRKM